MMCEARQLNPGIESGEYLAILMEMFICYTKYCEKTQKRIQLCVIAELGVILNFFRVQIHVFDLVLRREHLITSEQKYCVHFAQTCIEFCACLYNICPGYMVKHFHIICL